jgi:DNA (cytosine-5)-methyltransferase 1
MHKDALQDRGKSNLGEVINGMENMTVSGQLNPEWVEWLMGWTIGWTDLKPLEMGKFQQWLNSHGKY